MKNQRKATRLTMCKPFLDTRDPVAGSVVRLAALLNDFRPMGKAKRAGFRLRIHVLDAIEGETVHVIAVKSGSARVERGLDAPADIEVTLRRREWSQIARGKLSPLLANVAGLVRVVRSTRDATNALALVKHLAAGPGRMNFCGGE